MPKFEYSVRDTRRKLIESTGETNTKEELVRVLHAKGMTIITLDELKKVGPAGVKRRRLHRKVKLDDLTIFARQMAVLLESGVPVLKALSVMSDQVESSGLLAACKKMEEDVKSGVSLKDAVAKHPRIFSTLWVDLIETGEETGQLVFVLREIASYLDTINSLRKRVISALIYPAVLIAVSILAIFIFVYKVIPIFAGIYKSFGGQLPALTQAVINLSDALQKHLFKGLIVMGGCIFVLARHIKTDAGRKQFDGLKLRLPVLGGLFRSIAVERFTISLSMLIKGGISIVRALEVSARATANKVIEEALDKVKIEVIQGKAMSGPMTELGIFPPLVTHMIGVGEESGRIAQLLDEIAKFYADDISVKITRMINLFEPAVLVIMGGVIGTLVAAMYLPIFKMASIVGGGGR
ncbi:MAG: type II secretion system F family protein [Candidatus Omnitrophica bacterium]|nr:type II secretion system F family protein [Candidatus Omnitrophota bacterium]